MDQPDQGGPIGPNGKRLHIAHRRSPSEMTPLISQCYPDANVDLLTDF